MDISRVFVGGVGGVGLELLDRWWLRGADVVTEGQKR